MKNLTTIIICFSIALFCFLGCSKKSDTPSVAKITIQGKWSEDSVTIITYKNNKITNTYKESKPDGSSLQFNSNGTGIQVVPAYQSYPAVRVNITYSLSGSDLMLNYPAYEASGGSFEARTDKWTILTLTDHKLAMEYIDAVPNGSINQYFYYSR